MLASLAEALELILRGDSAVWEIVRLTVFVSGTALAIAALIGIPSGAWFGLRSFRGEGCLNSLVYTGMGFPPVVIGLLVFLLLSRQGPLAQLDWLFTPQAMILAQIILALPLVFGVTMSSVHAVPASLGVQLRSLGATEWQVVRTILIEARYGVVVGLVAGFGAAVSEVGAVMLVGGNIESKTRVMTTAIVLETRQGSFDVALALGIMLMSVAFLANVIAVRLQSD